MVCSWLLLIVSIALTAQDQKTDKPTATLQQQTRPPKTGEQVFNDNCVRCHTPPTVLSTRITGTIVMHMRTRARLSRKDEELLLKFFAP
jgi:hypothetical protein